MRWPWVSRVLYDVALKQIEELKASNADLLKLALEKTAAVAVAESDEEVPNSTYRPRRLVKDIRLEAEAQMLERFKASGAKPH